MRQYHTTSTKSSSTASSTRRLKYTLVSLISDSRLIFRLVSFLENVIFLIFNKRRNKEAYIRGNVFIRCLLNLYLYLLGNYYLLDASITFLVQLFLNYRLHTFRLCRTDFIASCIFSMVFWRICTMPWLSSPCDDDVDDEDRVEINAWRVSVITPS